MITFKAKYQTNVVGFCLNMGHFKDCEDCHKKIAISILEKAGSLRSWDWLVPSLLRGAYFRLGPKTGGESPNAITVLSN